MRYFYDCEFLEEGPSQPIYLLSIGVVCEDGRELYVQNLDCPLNRANNWVVANVFPHLEELEREPRIGQTIYKPNGNHFVWQHRVAIANRLLGFVSGPDIEFWGYYSAYDHVALCQLFGTMVNLPDGWPKYTRDLKQWCDDLGNPKLPEQGKNEHHALLDARWNKQVYDFLRSKDRG